MEAEAPAQGSQSPGGRLRGEWSSGYAVDPVRIPIIALDLSERRRQTIQKSWMKTVSLQAQAGARTLAKITQPDDLAAPADTA